MPEENENLEEQKTGTPEETTEPEQLKQEEPVINYPPTLAEDLEVLNKINILSALMRQKKTGFHPKKNIDALLKRRMNIPDSEVGGPIVVRLVATFMFIFITSALFWMLLWLLGTSMGWTTFTRTASIALSTVVMATFGIAVFQPMIFIDEVRLKAAIEKRMVELRDINNKGGIVDTTDESGSVLSDQDENRENDKPDIESEYATDNQIEKSSTEQSDKSESLENKNKEILEKNSEDLG